MRGIFCAVDFFYYFCNIYLIISIGKHAKTACHIARWEAVDAPDRMFTEMRSDPEAQAEMAVRENYIYIATPRSVNVKVFTILGQLISQSTLPAGIHRLPMSAKGIYIIKIGSSTRRVTI